MHSGFSSEMRHTHMAPLLTYLTFLVSLVRMSMALTWGLRGGGVWCRRGRVIRQVKGEVQIHALNSVKQVAATPTI
jgi:hypothetical protein